MRCSNGIWEAAGLGVSSAQCAHEDGLVGGRQLAGLFGQAHSFGHALNVGELLERLQMAGRKVAVERNGEIVPRGLHGDTVLENGDQLEIVVAVGGG